MTDSRTWLQRHLDRARKDGIELAAADMVFEAIEMAKRLVKQEKQR